MKSHKILHRHSCFLEHEPYWLLISWASLWCHHEVRRNYCLPLLAVCLYIYRHYWQVSLFTTVSRPINIKLLFISSIRKIFLWFPGYFAICCTILLVAFSTSAATVAALFSSGKPVIADWYHYWYTNVGISAETPDLKLLYRQTDFPAT